MNRSIDQSIPFIWDFKKQKRANAHIAREDRRLFAIPQLPKASNGRFVFRRPSVRRAFARVKEEEEEEEEEEDIGSKRFKGVSF